MKINVRRQLLPAILLLPALIFFLTACWIINGKGRDKTRISVSRSAGGGILGTAKLTGPSYGLRDGHAHEWRIRPGVSHSPVKEVFLRPSIVRGDSLLSDELRDECFAVSSDGHFKVRKAKLQECVESSSSESLTPELRWGGGSDIVALVFAGERFATRGTSSGDALSSETGRYLASWSRTIRPYGGGIPAPGMGRGEIVTYFLEIFDVSTKQVLLSASSEQVGDVSQGSWLGDHVFVLPYASINPDNMDDESKDLKFPPSCFLAIMPVK